MNVIYKDIPIDAHGIVLSYWKILVVQADFQAQALTVVVGGWLDQAAIETGKSPLYTFTLQFSSQMVQQFRRDYLVSLESGDSHEPAPNFAALGYDMLPNELTYDYVFEKVMGHPLFVSAGVDGQEN
jgi:hypothetical protein